MLHIVRDKNGLPERAPCRYNTDHTALGCWYRMRIGDDQQRCEVFIAPDYNPDPETKRVMGIVFEMARVALEREWGDHANAVIATRIIDLAKGGERNPDVLCDRALDDLRSQQGTGLL
jgi:hypothetical protein